MELWVRSQDKKRLISVTNLYIPISRNGEDFSIYTFDTDVELGIYKTEERAIEILDEIQNIFSLKIENTSYNEADLFLKAKMLNSCYQMPKN